MDEFRTNYAMKMTSLMTLLQTALPSSPEVFDGCGPMIIYFLRVTWYEFNSGPDGASMFFSSNPEFCCRLAKIVTILRPSSKCNLSICSCDLTQPTLLAIHGERFIKPFNGHSFSVVDIMEPAIMILKNIASHPFGTHESSWPPHVKDLAPDGPDALVSSMVDWISSPLPIPSCDLFLEYYVKCYELDISTFLTPLTTPIPLSTLSAYCLRILGHLGDVAHSRIDDQPIATNDYVDTVFSLDACLTTGILASMLVTFNDAENVLANDALFKEKWFHLALNHVVFFHRFQFLHTLRHGGSGRDLVSDYWLGVMRCILALNGLPFVPCLKAITGRIPPRSPFITRTTHDHKEFTLTQHTAMTLTRIQRTYSCFAPNCTTPIIDSGGSIGHLPPDFKHLRCARCMLYCYCSKECQAPHWQQHKRICRTIKLLTGEGQMEGLDGYSFNKLVEVFTARCDKASIDRKVFVTFRKYWEGRDDELGRLSPIPWL